MSVELMKLRTLIEHLDDLRGATGIDGIEDKLLAVLSYGVILGGCLSEYNFLALVVYAGVDLSDDQQAGMVHEVVSFYAGTGIIDLIDNGFGLFSSAKDQNNPAYQIGVACNIEDVQEAIKMMKESMFEDMSTENDLDDEDSEIESIGVTYCPNCKDRVKITDREKFIIHYSLGIKNPYAEAICEVCGTQYNIQTSWQHAYRFDAMGCPAVPFSFSRGEKITDIEIELFMQHFDGELIDFLDIVEKEYLERE
jgi:hypothetical protein